MMGCWGITAFESDAGLDSIDYIRDRLPLNGKLNLASVVAALQEEQVRLPDACDAEAHSSPMALAELLVKLSDHDMSGLDYNGEWAKKRRQFANLTSCEASKESLQWMRDYLADTLKYARENAQRQGDFNGWIEKKNWVAWQEHMEVLIGRLDGFLASPGDPAELLCSGQQECVQEMKC